MDGGGDAGLQAGRPFAGEADAVAAITKNEPADDAEAGGGELGEISVDEGGAFRGFEAEGSDRRGAEVPAVVEAEVQPHLKISAFRDAIGHMYRDDARRVIDVATSVNLCARERKRLR